jgi:hypothetical protein
MITVKIMVVLKSAEILNQIPSTVEPLKMAPKGRNVYDHITY